MKMRSQSTKKNNNAQKLTSKSLIFNQKKIKQNKIKTQHKIPSKQILLLFVIVFFNIFHL